MNDKKQYPKNLIWRNTKTREYEPIPEMTAKQLSYKLDFITSKLDKLKMNKIHFEMLRKNLLIYLVKKGTLLTSQENLPDRYIFLDGEKKEPIIVNNGTLEANKISVKEAIEKKLLIRIEKTEFSEDL